MDTYKCSLCGKTYKYAWSKEEAINEKNKNFGNIPIEDCAIICDPCYKIMMPAENN